jgi:heme-degrading monooxygenase HmoA
MYITVTSIKLRSVWYFFKLSLNGMRILKQTKGEKGFIKMKNTGFGYLHYTLSAWETQEDIKRFAHQGAHKEAMKLSKSLSTEIRIYTYQSPELPGWDEAKKLLAENGRILQYK